MLGLFRVTTPLGTDKQVFLLWIDAVGPSLNYGDFI